MLDSKVLNSTSHPDRRRRRSWMSSSEANSKEIDIHDTRVSPLNPRCKMPNQIILSTRLFIESNTNPKDLKNDTQIEHKHPYLSKESQRTPSNGCRSKLKQLRPRRANYMMATNLVVFLSLCIVAMIFQKVEFVFGQQQEPILPTVIVRGFLNYRTTVDGTVLVFTPDAGMSGQTSAPTAPLSTSSFIAPISTVEISPSPTVAPSPLATVAVPNVNQNQLLAVSEVAVSGEQNNSPQNAANGNLIGSADEWRPIQATPQLSARPVEKKPENELAEVVATTFVLTEPKSVAPEMSAQEPSQHASSHKQKRPQLGFNGQSIRWKPTDKARQNGASFIQQPSAANPTGSINGIRRPGLSTTTSTTATPAITVDVDGSQPTTNSTRGRLRGKFRRPQHSFLKQTTPSNIEESSSTAAPSNQGASVMQPAESGQDMVFGEHASGDNAPQVKQQAGDLVNPIAGIVPVDPQLAGASNGGALPVVGSDEILAPIGGDAEASLSKPMSRSGEQRPRGLVPSDGKMLTGQLVSTGQMSDPMSFDTLFQGDQPTNEQQQQQPAEASEHKPNHSTPKDSHHGNAKLNFGKGHSANDKLTGWMDQHSHSKFVPRPASNQHHEQAGRLSQQLSATLNQLEPSFSSNIPNAQTSSIKPTPVTASLGVSQSETLKPAVGSIDELTTNEGKPSSNETQLDGLELQTITKTYSTTMTATKTRLVPLNVKSTTAIYTITENYIITKMMTAYQTMPVGEFILPESSTRAPFEIFNEVNPETAKDIQAPQPAPAAASAPTGVSAPIESQEQPISLDTSPKSPNDWLHDFSNQNNPFGNQPNQQQQSNNNNNLAALLEQQMQQANGLSMFPGLMGTGEPLDQLASSLDPAALLADGAINIPDLNNPLVLAAAIQNPQLAAVILAAQQLQLQKRQKQLNQSAGNNQQQPQQQLQAVQLQPSYSTSLTTVIKPSTYTVRDTMYTTRLVSFKDGRTVRTRTVSEPGSVIEQVITTMATEVTPVTITIRPTGVLTVPSGGLATAPPGSGSGAAQSTINNALIATQLASLLARRQQQIQQPNLAANPSLLAGAATPQQLTALQQLLNQQQRSQATRQFQPNIQQLLQSMGQQPQQTPTTNQQQQQQPNQAAINQQADGNVKPASNSQSQSDATPGTGSRQQSHDAPIQQRSQIMQATQPITTVLTNLQVRTYTVHNAFKTIYRTITSTQLVTSTIFPGVGASQMPMMG